MSTWFDASTSTLVSWLTETASSFTIKGWAYWLESRHAGQRHASPRPVVFSTSQGAFASTPTRSTPAFLMASIRGLAPGAGTGTSAKAGAHNASASSSAKLRSMHLDMVPPEQPACTGIYGWLVTIIGEAVPRGQPRAPLSFLPLARGPPGGGDPAPRNSTRSWGLNERRTGPDVASPIGWYPPRQRELPRAASLADVERLSLATFNLQIENVGLSAGAEFPVRLLKPA